MHNFVPKPFPSRNFASSGEREIAPKGERAIFKGGRTLSPLEQALTQRALGLKYPSPSEGFK